METIKQQTLQGCVIGQSPVAAGLVCGLQAVLPLCLWRTAPLQLQFPLVALYKCYAFAFTFILTSLRHQAPPIR